MLSSYEMPLDFCWLHIFFFNEYSSSASISCWLFETLSSGVQVYFKSSWSWQQVYKVPFLKTICWLSQNLLYLNSNRNMCRGKILLSDIAETVHSDGDGRMSEACGGRRKYSGGNILVAWLSNQSLSLPTPPWLLLLILLLFCWANLVDVWEQSEVQ